MLAPLMPEIGAIEVSVGASTVNVTLPVVPIGVYNSHGPGRERSVSRDYEVRRDLSVTRRGNSVDGYAGTGYGHRRGSPSVRRPVRVTGTVVPLKPDVGAIKLSVGPVTENVGAPVAGWFRPAL